MELTEARVRAAVETNEQLEACLRSGKIQLIWLDSAGFQPGEYAACVEKVHAAGMLCGLRTPYIWRREAEQFFDESPEMLKQAGFDAWLFRNMEGALYFLEHGLTKETPFVTDHSLYVWTKEAEKILLEMLGTAPAGLTLPLELSGKELEHLTAELRTSAAGSQPAAEPQTATAGSQLLNESRPQLELVVYGRAPMMVSAQCLKKTSGGCRKGEEELLFLRDRTGARMPVRNYCRFCYNIIYNAVPTVLYDLDRELGRISPQAYRYEFSTESAAETFAVLEGLMPGKPAETKKPGNRVQEKAGASSGFTRGHLHRGV